MIEFTPDEVRLLYETLMSVSENLTTALSCGNEEVTNTLEVGSEIGRALTRIDGLLALAGNKIRDENWKGTTEVSDND